MKTLSRYVKHWAASASLPSAPSAQWPAPPEGRSLAVEIPRFGRAGASLVVYKTSADLFSKLVTLVVTVAAARALPAGDFGVMALAMTTGWLLGVASDAGLPMYLATRVAQAHGAGIPVYPIARAVMTWRTRLAVMAIVAATAAGVALVPFFVLIPFILIVLHQLFGAMLETAAHAFRGLGRTDVESSLSLAHRGAVAIGALTVLAVQPTLLGLSVALAVPPLVALVASGVAVRRLTADGPPFSLTRGRMLTEVAPLGLGVLLSALYFRCDVYFIERLHGVEAVGAYNAAFRIVDALRLFPAAALAVAYPLLCAATDLHRVSRLSLSLLAASVLAALGIALSAHSLLVLVYGEPYGTAGQALQVLGLCIPFFYVNYALTHQLIAWERQRAFVAIATVALVANLLGNAWLIPDGGMTGAAVSTLLTELVVLIGCALSLVRR
ncbi:MAG TPA: oligosaccharide flippase family protein [Vicinamibacterales bacterium]|nr:oligosaccharide flippase family protein [Vicinamibacterales bacterium]